MATPPQIIIDPLSACSLYLECFSGGNHIGKATGFALQRGGRNYLVTNVHVVAGINPDTGSFLDPSGIVPDEVRIGMHVSEKLGSWVQKSLKLRDQSAVPTWLAHPNPKFDVAMIDLDPAPPDVALYPLDWSLASTDMVATPAMPVSIIGFPLGLPSAGLFPIWKTGHIASEPDIDVDGQPVLLIDATTRGGMSGAPVVLRLSGGYTTRSGNLILAGGMKSRFLGVYSGRIHEDSEIGRVWRPRVIDEILLHNARPL